ncbi:MAG: glycoside hydrolase family 3 C-terminal domain-containing protein [Candidatus Sulfopaludibacter sp.]|nr:glycoside hydrolase family 3 C-terminal domain-containing protein [Candidatus Sulfopaludibacter sp.]
MYKRCILVLLAAWIGPGLGQQAPAGDRPPYLNPALPIDQRVDDLVSRMTVEEKASQFSSTSPAILRLQVPAYNWWSEALHGVANQGTATVFPQAIGLGATFDEPLILKMATTISTEARAKFHDYERRQDAAASAGGNLPGSFGGIRPGPAGLDYWSPNINIFRDPRWGRGQETYGEDPFLTGRLGAAFVRGLQGDDPKYFKTISTPKHYAVHSGPEPSRHTIDVKISLHDEEDSYLPAFRQAVVEGKADSVMCAYNSINGEPACANKFLLQDTLRGAWNFSGYVVSDCGAIADINRNHKFVPNIQDSAAISLRRGTDLDCGADTQGYATAIQTGLISEKEADVNLKRLFRARFQLGLFDPPSMVKYAQIPFSENDSAANRELSRKVAREAMVLLKNDGALPLKASLKKIAIVGPLADSIPALEGNYNGTSSRYVTPVDAIRKQFASVQVTYTPGTKFLRTPVTIPASAYHTQEGKPGLTAVYFNSKDLSGAPAATRTEEQLGFGGRGFVPGGGRLPEGVGAGDFSARYTGVLKSEDTDNYILTVAGAGGVRVWLDGKLAIDDWVEHPGGRGFTQDPAVTAARTTEMKLEKGKDYALKVEFFRTAQPAPAAGRGPGGGRGGFGPSGPTLSWRAGVNDIASAVAAARQADVVVAVVGITRELEGEEMGGRTLPEGFVGGDRTTLDLPKDEEALVEALKTTGKPLVIVIMNGSALGINWANQNANAILEAWYPGEEGGTAIAETLAGVNNPAGRLPVTFYKSVNDLPPFEDYSMKGRTYRYFEGQPLYPFGYGLSYSKFVYGNAKVSSPTLKAGSDLQVDVDVRNPSGVAGDEVVQAYLLFPKLPGAPLRALRGFQRVSIGKGQTQHVRLTLNARDLSMVNEEGTRLVAAGDYKLFVGGGQPGTGAPGAELALRIQGEQKLPR